MNESINPMISESETLYECSILLLTEENGIGKNFQEEIEKIKKTDKNKVLLKNSSLFRFIYKAYTNL